ncbi:hypothetical protein B0H14DRAFT_3085493 [Mycena olivaceomarginata]|nr:hypothetical protein B0H14DRAFT_3085493 [Mycena olivaceomarginata]
MNTTSRSTSPPVDLSGYRIPGHDACYYLPDFLTEEEEEYLIERLATAANFTGGELTSKNVLVAQPMPPFVEVYPDIIDRLTRTVFTPAGSPHGQPNHIIMFCQPVLQRVHKLHQPHEDGPAYFPVVATISLGSHCIFHYYQYKNDADGGTGGRSIETAPILSILLEPRSVVISEHALYSSHLHAIREIEEDTITAGNATSPPVLADLGVPIANWDRVTGADAIGVMSKGGVLKRATRYSLTCRDVEKVAQLKAFMKR